MCSSPTCPGGGREIGDLLLLGYPGHDGVDLLGVTRLGWPMVWGQPCAAFKNTNSNDCRMCVERMLIARKYDGNLSLRGLQPSSAALAWVECSTTIVVRAA